MIELTSIAVGLTINYLVEKPEARKAIKNGIITTTLKLKELSVVVWNRVFKKTPITE
jgi:hypothetical protein